MLRNVILGIAGLAMLVAANLGGLAIDESVTTAQAQEVDRAGVVVAWMAARNAADLDAAMAMLTEDAVAIHGPPNGPCPPQNPCIGQGIRPSLQNRGATYAVTSIETRGSLVVGQFEISAVELQERGIDRVVGTFFAEVPRDKISFYVGLGDGTDPQTARLFFGESAGR
jgi:hypothetical protein